MGGWWRWALVTPDGVAPSRMVGVSATVNLPLRHKVQKFSSGTGSPMWSRKKGHKTVVVWCGVSRAFSFACPKVWNSITVCARTFPSLKSFMHNHISFTSWLPMSASGFHVHIISLHVYLSTASQNYGLRQRVHSFQLPERSTPLWL